MSASGGQLYAALSGLIMLLGSSTLGVAQGCHIRPLRGESGAAKKADGLFTELRRPGPGARNVQPATT